ncbi:MAG TPA: serine/threonine-protein kinase [Planctomycetota bacterium]|nr:serine/threonine-protein kinase [Planctomycetota bacterium]
MEIVHRIFECPKCKNRVVLSMTPTSYCYLHCHACRIAMIERTKASSRKQAKPTKNVASVAPQKQVQTVHQPIAAEQPMIAEQPTIPLQPIVAEQPTIPQQSTVTPQKNVVSKQYNDMLHAPENFIGKTAELMSPVAYHQNNENNKKVLDNPSEFIGATREILAPKENIPISHNQTPAPDFATIADLERTFNAPKKFDKIGNYKLIKKIGSGAMGVIHLAQDETTKQIVALKLLNQDLNSNQHAMQRFIQEGRVHEQLHHPNIVDVKKFDYCEKTEHYYIAMEYVEGVSLEQVLIAKKKIAVRDAIKIAISVAHALEHVFEKKIIHRDLKPANIMIDRKTKCIKVTDFGLGKIDQGKGATLTGQTIGTPYYMSNEQIKNSREVDHRSDIYSLGATLYHMITGVAPYSEIRGTLAILRAKSEKETLPIETYTPECPQFVSDIVMKSMSRDVEERYQTPTEFLQDLKKALSIK